MGKHTIDVEAGKGKKEEGIGKEERRKGKTNFSLAFFLLLRLIIIF